MNNTQVKLNKIIDNIADEGYIILDDVLDEKTVQVLAKRIRGLKGLKEAKIGRGNERQNVSTIRSDKTLWLEGKDESEKAYLTWMKSLKQNINKELYLGLHEYEAHFAHYEEGAFYQKHVDVLKGSNKRLLTTVFYLTADWKEGDGGELLIYDEKGQSILEKVEPKMGRMVVFLSDKFPHEVLPSKIDRYSIAGWFRSF